MLVLEHKIHDVLAKAADGLVVAGAVAFDLPYGDRRDVAFPELLKQRVLQASAVIDGVD